MKKAIFRMDIDFRRGGSLEGIFVSTVEAVDMLTGREIQVYFGEVNGKHSEVYGAIEPHEIAMVTDNPEVVKIFEENNLSSGYNPLQYFSTNFPIEDYFEDYEPTVGELVDKLLELEK